MAKLGSIGVVPGQPFDLNKNGSDTAKAIADGVEDGKKKVAELAHNPGNNKIVYPIVRGDGDGNPLDGANKYLVHFEKGQTPPVNAFW